MGREYTAKSFKSGNSVAIRVPAGLGIEPNREWSLTEEEDGALVLRAKPPEKRLIDVTGFAGKAPWLKPLPAELKEFEERPSTLAARRAARP
jgi:antitoxin VapB